MKNHKPHYPVFTEYLLCMGHQNRKSPPPDFSKSRVSTKASPTLPCFLQHQLFLIYLLLIQARDNLYVVAYSCNPALRSLGAKNYKFKVRLDYKINLLVCFLTFLWSESSLVDLINFTPFFETNIINLICSFLIHFLTLSFCSHICPNSKVMLKYLSSAWQNQGVPQRVSNVQ